jgi:hypothetical protein
MPSTFHTPDLTLTRRHSAELDAFVATLWEDAKSRASSALAATAELAGRVQNTRIEGIAFCSSRGFKFQERFTAAKKLLEDADKAARNKSYFGYLDAIDLCEKANGGFLESRNEFREVASARLLSGPQVKIAKLKVKIHNWEQSSVVAVVIALFGLVLAVSSAWNEGARVWDANSRQAQLREEYKNRAFSDLRRRGLDPNVVSIEQARKLGWRSEDVPAQDIGETFIGAALKRLLLGVLLTAALAWILNSVFRSAIVSWLRAKKRNAEWKLNKVQSKLAQESRSVER